MRNVRLFPRIGYLGGIQCNKNARLPVKDPPEGPRGPSAPRPVPKFKSLCFRFRMTGKRGLTSRWRSGAEQLLARCYIALRCFLALRVNYYCVAAVVVVMIGGE